MTPTTPLHGGCHCGALLVEFTTRHAPAAMTPRACDCSFCRKHGAAWVSDPAGRLRLLACTSALHAYRQGSDTARFYLCAQCGVLVAVTVEHAGRLYGAINATCMDERDAFAPAACASPQRLGADEKVERWRQLWVPDVELVMSERQPARSREHPRP